MSETAVNTENLIVQPRLRGNECLCHFIKVEHLHALLVGGDFHAKRVELYRVMDGWEAKLGESDEAKWHESIMNQMSLEDREVIEDIRRSDNPLKDLKAFEKCPYIVCFRRDRNEDLDVWRTYLNGEDGVMLRTSRRRLKCVVGPRIGIAPVFYTRPGVEEVFDPKIPIFYIKKGKFIWEHEVRMCHYQLQPAFLPNGGPYDIDTKMWDALNAADPDRACRECLQEIIDLGVDRDLTSFPDFVKIPVNTKANNGMGAFPQIVLSPGIPIDGAREVRRIVAEANLDPACVVKSKFGGVW